MKILIEAEFSTDKDLNSSFGGLPVTYNIGDYDWPVCQQCELHMQFIGKLLFEKNDFQYLALLFMCANEREACSSWDAFSAANKVIKLKVDISRKLKHLSPPANADISNLIRSLHYGCDIVYMPDFDDYEAACANIRNFLKSENFYNVSSTNLVKPIKPDYLENVQLQKPFILGQIYGEPYWLQGDDEIPYCQLCNKPKIFLALLEEGPRNPEKHNWLNFGGGGIAYIFDCECFQMSMIWQS